jgi:hypothetical protein
MGRRSCNAWRKSSHCSTTHNQSNLKVRYTWRNFNRSRKTLTSRNASTHVWHIRYLQNKDSCIQSSMRRWFWSLYSTIQTNDYVFHTTTRKSKRLGSKNSISYIRIKHSFYYRFQFYYRFHLNYAWDVLVKENRHFIIDKAKLRHDRLIAGCYF